MAKILLPFHQRTIEANTNYFTIVKHPFSSCFACVSPLSIDFRDYKDFAFKIIKSIQVEQPEGLCDTNEWAQFTDKDHLFIGTKNGFISCVSLNADFNATTKKFDNISVSSTFSAFRNLGIITNTNEIMLISNDLSLLPYKIGIDSDSAVLSPIFYQRAKKPSLLSVVDNKVCFIKLTPKTLKKNLINNNDKKSVFKLKMQTFSSFENPRTVSLNPGSEFIAAASENGSISFLSTNFPNNQPIKICLDSSFKTDKNDSFNKENNNFNNENNNIKNENIETNETKNENNDSLKENNNNNIKNVNESKLASVSQIQFMRWTHDDEMLIIISTGGVVNLFELSTYTVYMVVVPAFAENGIKCIEYDEETRTMYANLKEKNELVAVEFATLQRDFAFSSSLLYNIKTKKSVIPKIYPILFSNKCLGKSKHEEIGKPSTLQADQKAEEFEYVVASYDRIQKNEKIIVTNGVKAIQVVQNDYIFVFSMSNEQLMLSIFDENLCLLKEIDDFPHVIHSVSYNFTERILIVSCHSMYTIISLNFASSDEDNKCISEEEEETTKNKNEKGGLMNLNFFGKKKEESTKDENPRNSIKFDKSYIISDNFSIQMKTNSSYKQLKNVVYTSDFGVFLHYADGTSKGLNSNFSFQNVRYIYTVDEASYLIIQLDHSYYLIKDKIQSSFQGVSCFSDLCNTFTVNNCYKFGEISYSLSLFAPYLLLNSIGNVDKKKKKNKYYCKKSLFEIFYGQLPFSKVEKILSIAITTCVDTNYRTLKHIKHILNDMDIKQSASVITKAFQSFKEAGKENAIITLIKKYNLNWGRYFRLFNYEIKLYLLKYLNSMILDEILIDNEEIITITKDNETGNIVINSNKENKETNERTELTRNEVTVLIDDLMKKHSFLRVFRLCESLCLNFVSLFQNGKYIRNGENSLKELINLIEKDRNEFYLADEDGMIKFMGTTLGTSKETLLLSFAIFVVLEEDAKIQTMFQVNKIEISEIIIKYVHDNPKSKYSSILKNLLNV